MLDSDITSATIAAAPPPPRQRRAAPPPHVKTYWIFNSFSNFSASNNIRKPNLTFLERLQRKLFYDLYPKFIKFLKQSLLVKRASQNVTKIYFLTSCDLWWPWWSILNYSLLHNLDHLLSIKHKFKYVVFLEAEIPAL